MKFSPFLKCFTLGLLCLGFYCPAQDFSVGTTRYGIYGGLNLAFGTHFQRMGLNLGFYFNSDWFQSNSEIKFYRSWKNLGPKGTYNELVLTQGIVYAYGQKDTLQNNFHSSVSNQSRYQNSIAYAYNAYFNKMSTTQQTGNLNLQFNDFYFITENDLLAKPSLDRFRTGAFLLMYQYQNQYQFALNCSMWTGQMGPGHLQGNFSRCYMDTTGGRFVGRSHGLLSAQVKAVLPYSQVVQANIGLDAEQVRDAVQNKLFHDMVFLPKSWRPSTNCHIPMIGDQGEPYLYQEGQKIRKSDLYLNVFGNPSLFY